MRIIGHLDMDAFFAAIEERNNPQFQGLPIVVGADPRGGAGRGVVSTANYAAREYGIRSAMPITRAWRLSQAAKLRGRPETVFLSGSWRTYSSVSRNIMNIIARHAPAMQQRSVDEAYFDLTSAGSLPAAEKICRAIKAEIKDHEHLTASIGLGPNKLIAKIASDYNKPDGLTIITAKDAEAFLEPLSVRAIPGIGPRAEEILKQYDVATVADAKRLSAQELHNLFGLWGDDMYEKLRGRDTSPLREHEVAKSVGHNQTFFHDTLSPAYLLPKLTGAAEEVFARLHDDGFNSFRTVVVTVRFADFVTKTRAKTLPTTSRSLADLRQAALQLFLPFLDHRENPQGKLIRLIGVRVEKIS
jgi:DNA polymerase IV (DinB-like DNA polymerase)